jgi:uncharacterized membrane protein YbhN (UPF0104 family)
MSLRLAADPRNPETLEGGPRATARTLGRAFAVALGRADRIVRARGFRIATRSLVGVAVLVAIVVRAGAEPFVHGLLSLDLTAVIVAVVLFAVATAAAAWRWTLIARRLGATLLWRTAVGMYYRSQLVNTLLPGGVIGDVQRAVDHGRASARSGGAGVGAASRAVAIERVLGQAVQVVLTIGVLAMVGAEFEGVLLPCIGIGLSVVAAATAVALRSGRVRRALRREARELGAGLGSLRVSAQAVAASIVVFGCHLAIFVVAATAVGAAVPPGRLLALSTVVLLAAAIPFNIGGWGPREGAAGWAFAVAGFGAAAGISAATLYGVLALLAVAPGAAVAWLAPLVVRRRRR